MIAVLVPSYTLLAATEPVPTVNAFAVKVAVFFVLPAVAL